MQMSISDGDIGQRTVGLEKIDKDFRPSQVQRQGQSEHLQKVQQNLRKNSAFVF